VTHGRFRRRGVWVALAAALATTLVGGWVRAAAGGTQRTVDETYPVPPGGTYTIAGRGFGHGHGMSQWGAYGAAKVADLSSNQILHFYYPNTTLATEPATQNVRVLLSTVAAAQRGHVDFDPAAGLQVTPSGATPQVLPTSSSTGQPIDLWRVRRSAGVLSLRAHWSGAWHDFGAALGTSVAISDTAALIGVVEPVGNATKTVRYRGAVDAEIESGSLEAVNDVPIESYIQGVVPAEMPPTWSAAALEAQAVAARTYAWRGVAHPKTPWADLYGDTRDQAYGGYDAETAAADAAVHDTAGEVIVDSTGAAILAQYFAADGGWTVSGGTPYLPAQHDPYDGTVPNDAHSWTAQIAASAIAAAYPAVGTLRRLVITGRDGHGVWGGRVTTIQVVGSSSTQTVSGSDFQLALGLRSPWFRPTPPPGPPLQVAASSTGPSVTVSWKPPAAAAGAAPVTGYKVSLSPGGRTTKVDASTAQAVFSGVPPGSYTASVMATSAAGNGPAATAAVTVKAV
jgi:SpoIID/LytB domain protein